MTRTFARRMSHDILAGLISGSLLLGAMNFQGCKTVAANGVATAPTLTYTQATNATLQGLHKYAMDTATALKDGTETMSATGKQAFNAFAVSLNTADALFIAYSQGTATQAQVSAAVSQATTLQQGVQNATTGVK